MTETWNTPAIVLGYQPWREADRLYIVYTEQFGKLTMRAQSIRKPTSKLAGCLEPVAEIDLYGIAAQPFPRIGGAVVRQRFFNNTSSWQQRQASLWALAVVDQLTQDGEVDQRLYQELYSMLNWCNSQSIHRTVSLAFIIKVIAILGHDLRSEATPQTMTPELTKTLQWLVQQDYDAVLKLRFSPLLWQSVMQLLYSWLQRYRISAVQLIERLI